MADCCPYFNPLCRKHVVCRYIIRNGKVIYPRNSDFFSFCVEDEEKAVSSSEEATA